MDTKERIAICKSIVNHIIEVQDKGYAENKLNELVNAIDNKFVECLSNGNYRYDAFVDNNTETEVIYEDDEFSMFDFSGMLKRKTAIEAEFELAIGYIIDETGALMSVLDTESLEIAVEDKLNERYKINEGTFSIDINMDNDILRVAIAIVRD